MISRRLLTCVSLILCLNTSVFGQKINGLSLVAPHYVITQAHHEPIKATNANWVAVTPYAFCRTSNGTVTHGHSRQWHGEKEEGMIQAIELAKANGLKVMLKPHVWVAGASWIGDLDYSDPVQLALWQKTYTEYILNCAKIASEYEVSLFAIGTELKLLVKRDPNFFIELISLIRSQYQGQITYAANWDNYERIPFWSELDYIGIDAYFPTNEQKTPHTDSISTGYIPLKKKLATYSSIQAKPILFTEVGFRSMDFASAGHWEQEHKNQNVNLTAQANAYQGLFDAFWDESWFSGGFIWKWFYKHNSAGGASDSHFTPQNKPAEKVIRSNFGKSYN